MEKWKLEILKCKCDKPEFEVRMEKVICKNCGTTYLLQNNILCVEEKEMDEGTAFYTKVKGTILSQRAKVKFTTTYFETKIYHNYLRRYSPTNKSSLILDVGCGDGRNMKWFMERGYEHIVGTDSNYEGLLRLQEKIDDETKKNVFLIQCNALDLPFKSNAFNFVLAIEILNYLNERYDLGVKECHRVLKRNFHFLESEPSRMGMLLWSVVEGNLKNAFKTYEEHLFKETFNNNFVFHRVFTSKEIESIHRSIGLQVIEKKGTSLIPVMLSHAYRHGHIADNASEKELRKIEQICNKSSKEEAYYRCIVFYSMKT